jgi:uncharacterized protein
MTMCRMAIAGVIILTHAAFADEIEIPTIEVDGVASISQEPDQAVIQLSVETFEETALAATQKNAEKMTLMVAQLKKLGVKREQIQTTHYQVDPQYDYKDGRPMNPRAIGYRVHNTVEIDIQDLEQVGKIIDRAIQSGANRVLGLSFQVRDRETAYQQALGMAMENAKKQADAIAAGASVGLGRLLWVSTSGQTPGPVFKQMRAEAMLSANTPISGGGVAISATIRARYQIVNP